MVCDAFDLMITTRCERRCPDCCCGLWRGGVPWDVTPAEAGRVAAWAGPVRTLYVTGGEPTMHPAFRQVVEAVWRSARAGRLILATEGSRVMDDLPALAMFDAVMLSHYSAASGSHGEANTATIQRLRRAVLRGPRVLVRRQPHRRGDAGRSEPCGRARRTAAYCQGRVWGCCVGPGRALADSALMGPGWREDVGRLYLDCRGCPFAV